MSYRERFDDYVSCQKANAMVKLVLRSLVEEEDVNIPSPILVIGDSGTGKTHLIKGVLEGFAEVYPYNKVVYFHAEEFANKLIQIYKEGNHEDACRFKSECRKKTTLMVVEDIHFLFDKIGLMSELIKTIDHLVMNSSTVILTSSVDPKTYSELPPRILSRLLQGLTLHLSKADFGERREILQRYCWDRGLALSEEVQSYICSNVLSVRRIEGAVNRLALLCQGKLSLSLNECAILIRDLVSQTNSLDCSKIIDGVSKFYGYTPQQLISKSRDADLVMARQIAEYLTFKLLDCSLADMERYFDRDRSTISYSIRKIQNECAQNSAMQSRVESLIRILVPEQGL